MDSQRLKAYKKEMQACFRRAMRDGYVEWNRIGDLDQDIVGMLGRAEKEFSTPETRWDLFHLACAVALKWDKTDMDDDGDMAWVMQYVAEAWGKAVDPMTEADQRKALSWFMERLDGKVDGLLKDCLYDFMDTHFKSPHLLVVKRKFLENKMAEETEKDPDSYTLFRCKEYLLQILSDEGAPMDEVERYAAGISRYDIGNRMLRIYRERGEKTKEISLLEQRLTKEDYHNRQYEERLKELYRETGLDKKYRFLLARMFYQSPDDRTLYKEYKALFTKEAWQEELNGYILPTLRGEKEAMPLFAREKRYDLLMEAAEKAGTFNRYERTLMKIYPERCLQLLVRKADDFLERMPNRKGYQIVAATLRRMWKYPGGRELSHTLAERYRNKYPRRSAMREELMGI